MTAEFRVWRRVLVVSRVHERHVQGEIAEVLLCSCQDCEDCNILLSRGHSRKRTKSRDSVLPSVQWGVWKEAWAVSHGDTNFCFVLCKWMDWPVKELVVHIASFFGQWLSI